jgi:hypothetical protein
VPVAPAKHGTTTERIQYLSLLGLQYKSVGFIRSLVSMTKLSPVQNIFPHS